MLACWRDRIVLENFTYGDTPATRSLALMLKEVLELGEVFDVSVYELSGRHDIRPLVVETVLTYLELDGIIASTGPFYNEYKFQTLRPAKEIFAKFDAQRRGFLEALFKSAEMGRSWMKLDIAVTTQITGSDRKRVVSAMNYLEEQGDIKLEVAGARQGYRRLRGDFDLRALAEKMAQQFAQRERRDVERIGMVLSFTAHQGCRTAALLKYFGEPLDGACGHCDVCRRESSGAMARESGRTLGEPEIRMIRELKSQRLPALSTPRPMARFLCGINSPALTRAKLKEDRRFGALEDLPFSEVLKAVTEA
jgi:ATP-dependent DNA helicase RecQ